MVKIHFIEKFTSQTPIFFACFGGTLLQNISFKQKITELRTPKKYFQYLQKDSLEHFELYCGN